MWSLTGGNPSSQWSDWVGEICDFYNPDGTIQQDPAQYLTLADRILLTGTYYTFQEPELANVSLILTRQNSDPDPSPAPVPEPPAAVLFFAGMICLFPHNKHKPAHKTH